MFKKWRKQRKCFHHDINAKDRVKNGGYYGIETSYIRSELIDTGKRKRFWCNRCERVWIF